MVLSSKYLNFILFLKQHGGYCEAALVTSGKQIYIYIYKKYICFKGSIAVMGVDDDTYLNVPELRAALHGVDARLPVVLGSVLYPINWHEGKVALIAGGTGWAASAPAARYMANGRKARWESLLKGI